MKKTLIFSHPLFFEHGKDLPFEHPECPARLESILSVLKHSNFGDQLSLEIFRLATHQELSRVHTADYVDQVFSLDGRWGNLDYETSLSPGSVQSALLAVGLGLELVKNIIQGQAKNGFLLARPPGHHALPDRAMGFCIFNSIALAAYSALDQGLERVLILDWDVHHGNGTQKIFYEEDRVLFLDLHQDQLFPEGSGTINEQGEGKGKGFTFNIPLPHSCGDADYFAVLDQLVAPVVQKFKPELILVSAGFDAHQSDPLGSMLLTSTGYGGLAQRVKKLAEDFCQGKLILFLEGGYQPTDLAENVLQCVSVLNV